MFKVSILNSLGMPLVAVKHNSILLYRIVVVNVVAVFWNTYLALMSERVHKHDAIEHTQESLPVDGETAKLS